MIAASDTHEREPPAEGGGGGSLGDVRVGVVKRLRSRRSEIDDAIFARIRDAGFDPAGSDDIEYVQGLRAAVVAGADYVLAGIERSREFSEPVPTAAIAQAQRAARAGIGLDTVLRRYVVGYALLEDFLMQEAERNDLLGQGSALREVLGAAATLVDRMIIAVSGAYREELERVGHIPRSSDDIAAADRRKKGSDRAGSVASGGGSGVSPGPRVGMQRARILQAMVEVGAERGFANTSVKLLTSRARVSSRTFYEQFENLQDCLLAVLDLPLERAGGRIAQAFAQEDQWQNGVLGALAALLVFFDSEPQLTRVWFVEAMAAGSWALERREHVVAQLRSMIVEHWALPDDERIEPRMIAGGIASVLGLIQTHLVNDEPGPLIELLGPLMNLVAAPYLDTADLAREVERGAQLAREIQSGESRWAAPAQPSVEQDMELPAMLVNPSARRARECICFLSVHPDASNREVATGIGVTQKSQISTLLAYLLEEDLAVKCSEGPGKRNAWRLTPRGEEIAQALVKQDQLSR